MKLHQLFSIFTLPELTDEQTSLLECEITGLYFDARLVKPNSVFVAVRGSQNDGHDFIGEANKNGAVALVVENESKVRKQIHLLNVKVDDSRYALDQLATRFYQYPSEDLFCFGVTGTNGKTSITYILEHILNDNRKLTGVLGTVNHRVAEKIWPTQNTTPDPVTLQMRLRDFLNEHAQCAAIEVTSHALDQKRVESVQFNTVVFTNLTLDHLDYHKSMQIYFEAKQRLFTDLMEASKKIPKYAIVNIDDTYGRKLRLAEDVVCWTYGQKESDFQFRILNMNFAETEFEIKSFDETLTVKLPITGEHTIYNIVAGVAAAKTYGISIQKSFSSLKSFFGVPGRLQRVESASDKIVFVDYAHTPDALENVLKTLQAVKKKSRSFGKILTVFGCGGDRDKSKRPIMGRIAAEFSDFIFITSDNPRSENPLTILKDIESGMPANYSNFTIECDREQAIRKAILAASFGDVVLIAGKGHEDYQIVGGEKKYFSDIEVAGRYL